MKRVWLLAFAVIMVSFSLIGCKSEDKVTEQQPITEETHADDSDIPDTSDTDEVDEPESNVLINVYYSNEDATEFVQEEVSLEELSPENVLAALVEKEVLTEDISVISFSVSEVDGKQSIDLDLNDAFAPYINNMGSTGEYFVIGSLCNTFLDAYDCEQMKISVNGGILETGHAEYPGYLHKFQL